jgi:hypothetical protein
MTVRGFLDRAKDASSISLRAVPPGSSAYALFRVRRRRSPPRRPGDTPLSPARPPVGEESHYERDGPAEVSAPTCSREGARLPGDQGAFHPHERELQQDFSWTVRAGLLFAPPTRSPQGGEKCRWSGIASLEASVPRF